MARTVCSGEQAGELFRAATSLSRNEKALLILRKHSEKANDTLARNQMLDFAFNSAIIQDQNLTPSKRVILTLAQNETLALNSAIKKDIKSELLVTRVWSASEHPQWVAFEMEGALQIRPAQYAIAMTRVLPRPMFSCTTAPGLSMTACRTLEHSDDARLAKAHVQLHNSTWIVDDCISVSHPKLSLLQGSAGSWKTCSYPLLE
jgi:hypothetical protein